MAEDKSKPVDLNSADFDTLSHLPMVGERRAQFIMENRPFKTWEDVQKKVPGFSEGMVEDLKKGKATLGGKK